MPGTPGYTMPGPGDPGYTEPGGDVGGAGGSMHPPSGLSSSPGDLGGAASPGGSVTPPTGDPCADVDDPTQTVSFSYTTQGMGVDETQEFAVTGNHPRWSYEAYEWKISGGGGSMTRSGEAPPDPIYGPEEEDYDPEARMFGFDVTLTAPADNAECAKNPTIELWCGGELMASLNLAVNATTGYTAYRKITDTTCDYPGYGWNTDCWVEMDNIDCDGSVFQVCDGMKSVINTAAEDQCPEVCAGSSEELITCSVAYALSLLWAGHPIDQRTEAMLTEGCCPEELL